MTVERFNSEAAIGYTQITTFYEDFSIAEHFGERGIRDTYRRAFKGWKNSYKYLTELVMVLNWKLWRWYGKNNTYATIYNELWEKAKEYAETHLEGEELVYYYRTID